MTESEAKSKIKHRIGVIREIAGSDSKSVEDLEIAIQALKEIREYRELGTVEELKALKEKNEPKKPIRNDECTCPSCGTHNEVVEKRRNTVAFDTVYCWHCGQSLEI